MVQKNRLFSLLFFALLILGAGKETTAQEVRKSSRDLKNTIHFNITNPIIFGNRALVFGYERVINNRQSFSVNLGANDFPKFSVANTDSISLTREWKETGVNFSVDYRFYPAKENKFSAPRGMYFGPFYSFNSYGRKNEWSVKRPNGSDAIVNTNTKLNFHTLGIELGYQFVFWERLSVDMILIGPGISHYNLKALVDSNLTPEEKEKLYEKINDALEDRFPGYSLIIKEGEFKKNGAVNTVSFGYRYMIQVGFRF